MRTPVNDPGPTVTAIPARSAGHTPAPAKSSPMRARRSQAWRPRSPRCPRATISSPRASATLARPVAVSIPRIVIAKAVSAGGQAAAAQELRDLGLLVVPFEEEDGPHLVALRLTPDLPPAQPAGAQCHPRLVASVLADDHQLVADGVRPVALEQKAAPADVQRRLRLFPDFRSRPVGRGHPDLHLLPRHVEPDVIAALAVEDADRVPAARLRLVHRLLGAPDQAVRHGGVRRVLGQADG